MKIVKIPFCIVAILMAGHSYGGVVLQDSYEAGAAGGAPTDLGGGTFGYEIDVTSSFSAAGHGKLVFTGSLHDGAANDGNSTTITKVTYGGTDLTEAVVSADNWIIVSAGIFYLDNVASDGILRIELSSSAAIHYGFGLYAVDGLKAGVQDTGFTLRHSTLADATVTMTTDEGFYVQEATRNNQTLADSADDYETLYNYSADNYRALSQYQVTSAAGDYLAPTGNGGANAGTAVAAAFEAVSVAATELKITSFTAVGSGMWELTLQGEPGATYEFRSSTTLDFSPGTLVPNLTQGNPGSDPGTIDALDPSQVTTDGSGAATVQMLLSGDPADFVRAQSIP